ncbi:MAG: hypothetical protein F6K22_18905 [Okeania sp. SIO2F4]|uniref:hypothetical protein n=1 Tax=Okeania sp. SIO2F4 TaxID=2607790 RepID=UPI00142ABFE3|nr:hypothetical protein [Okeania sp. SIO2F4]NES04717.1 hypothetical protein [Okeania sp. SIO2F4]
MDTITPIEVYFFSELRSRQLSLQQKADGIVLQASQNFKVISDFVLLSSFLYCINLNYNYSIFQVTEVQLFFFFSILFPRITTLYRRYIESPYLLPQTFD